MAIGRGVVFVKMAGLTSGRSSVKGGSLMKGGYGGEHDSDQDKGIWGTSFIQSG